MALSIKSPEADRLARDLAALTGKPITEAVAAALQAELEREKNRQLHREQLIEDVMAIASHCASLPVLEPCPDLAKGEEITGSSHPGQPMIDDL